MIYNHIFLHPRRQGTKQIFPKLKTRINISLGTALINTEINYEIFDRV